MYMLKNLYLESKKNWRLAVSSFFLEREGENDWIKIADYKTALPKTNDFSLVEHGSKIGFTCTRINL